MSNMKHIKFINVFTSHFGLLLFIVY